MTWYTAKCAFLSIHEGDEPPGESLGEYGYFLLQAENEDVARQNAVLVAKANEHSYQNVYGANVRWVFDRVVDVKQLFDENIVHGTEIYYEFFSVPENKE